jgi:serpin B
LFAACSSGKITQSRLERVLNPDVPALNMDQLIAGKTPFAFDLYLKLSQSNGNVVFTPYSISLAFTMVYGVAQTEKADQIATALH